MQSLPRPLYIYDATGKLVYQTLSGVSNDTVAKHELLDPRLQGPRSASAGGLNPTIMSNSGNPTIMSNSGNPTIMSNSGNPTIMKPKSTILNSPSLFTSPLSFSSPPVERPTTFAAKVGYNIQTPSSSDLFTLTTAQPILNMDRPINNVSHDANLIGRNHK